MKRDVKIELNKYFDLADECDKFPFGVAKRIQGETTRHALEIDLVNYLMYISASLGSITWAKTLYINENFQYHFTPDEIVEYIQTQNIYSTEYENTAPLSYRTFVELELDAIAKQGDAYDDYYCSNLIMLYSKITIDFIEYLQRNEDEELDERVTDDVEIYANTLSDYAKTEHRKFFEAFTKKDETVDNIQENTEPEQETLDNLLHELNELTGLSVVKNDVNSIINLLRVRRIREERGLKQPPMSMHLVFSGNPGTGKTTVARLLAKIYYHLGVLSKGHLVEVDRSGLVGGYVGQTAIKVKEVINKSIGGVLFIDEAYSLTAKKGENDYGLEAVDTLLKGMEDHRNDLIVIVAGYPDLMNEFLASNPGLRSRFNKFMYFEDYTPDELVNIFESMCKKAGYSISADCLVYVKQYFEKRYLTRTANFANARDVRNFFEMAMVNQANRLATDFNITDEELTEFVLSDVRDIVI